MTEDLKEIFRKIRFYSFWFAFGLICVIGLVFLTIADMKLSSQSTWLFYVALCTMGSAICTALSESFKEKKIVCILLKSIGIVCAALFLVVVLIYENEYIKTLIALRTKNVAEEVFEIKRSQAIEEAHKNFNGIKLTSVIFAIAALISQVVHLVSSIFTIDDDK